MPQASILDLEQPPLDRPRRPSSRRPGAGGRGNPANATAPAAALGRLYLIERCGGELGLTAAEQAALVSANIIVYERSLAGLVAAVLPLGAYAEPAPEAEQTSAGQAPVFERCLKFALDGWSVVQLMERRPRVERARWPRDAAEQLVSAGVSGDIPVLVLVDAACGGPLKIETRLHSAQAIIDQHGLPGGLMMVLGPIVPGPAPPVYAFAANGLAG
jgi:siroheme synthase